MREWYCILTKTCRSSTAPCHTSPIAPSTPGRVITTRTTVALASEHVSVYTKFMLVPSDSFSILHYCVYVYCVFTL